MLMPEQYNKMEEFRIIKNKSSLAYINTPWNEKSLILKSNEIMNIKYRDVKDINDLLEEFEKKSIEDKVELSVSRVSNNSEVLKKLQESGFIKTEVSLEVFLSFKKKEKYKTKSKIELSNYRENFLEELKSFAYHDFHFGRFLEDFKIPISNSRRRTALWIEDLNSDATVQCFLGLRNGVFIGFMYFKVKENKVELVLGGVTSNYAHLATEFWKELINKFFNFHSITTVISASNPMIINMYSELGFKFKKSLIGLHKHRVL